MSINILCWSMNRACQLDALLTSLKKYVPATVNVLYKASDFHFEDAYEICKREHPFTNFVREKDFYDDTIQLSEQGKSICYTTDDTVVFGPVHNLQKIKDQLNNNTVFSFRLGYNTVVQDHLASTLQPPLIPDKVTEEYLYWNPKKYPWLNYGYPHALDMHLYSTDYILPILKQIRFKTTNELEGILQKFNSNITMLFSLKESIAVNVPINNISLLTGVNRRSMSLEDMNAEYLKGKRLKYIFDSPVIGCHQDVGFEFV